jgi:histone deacetylase 1/2
MSVYYNKVKTITDTLASIGQPLRPEEFVSAVLHGLDEEYDSLAEVVRDRETPMPAHDLYARLMSTEQRKEGRRSTVVGGVHSTNAAKTGGYRPPRSTAPTPPPLTYRPSSGPGAGARPPGPGGAGGGAPPYGRGNGPRPHCQLCDEVGHLAARCFKRFQKSFLGVGNDGRFLERQLAQANVAYQAPQGQTSTLPVDPTWYADTGATDHLTGQLEKLHMKEPYQGSEQVHTGNGEGMRISHVGQALISTPSSRHLYLRNVLHVPRVTKNLLFVRRFTYDNRVYIEFHPNSLFVKDLLTGTILLRGRVRGGLYVLDAPLTTPLLKQVFSALKASSSQWHARLGHPATQVVQHVLHHHQLLSESNKIVSVCDACQQGKSHQLPFSVSQHVTNAPLELIYSDVWGPSPQTSVSGHSYYVSFVDAYSRFTWLYLIKRKNDVFEVFRQYQAHVERLLGHKIKYVQSDWRGEYIKLNAFFQELGITHRVSCSHTHQQNGSAE